MFTVRVYVLLVFLASLGMAFSTTSMVLQTEYLEIALSAPNGLIQHVIDRSTNRSLWESTATTDVHAIFTAFFDSSGGNPQFPDTLEWSYVNATPSSAKVWFNATWKQGLSVTISSQVLDSHRLRFDLVQRILPHGANELSKLHFLSVPFNFQSACASNVGGCWDTAFSAVVQPINAYTVVGAFQGAQPYVPCLCTYNATTRLTSTNTILLTGSLTSDIGGGDIGAVLWTGTNPSTTSGTSNGHSKIKGSVGENQILSAIQENEKQFNLPSPTIDGEWAVTSPLSQQGYLFLPLDPQDLNETIAYAKAGGFGNIMPTVESIFLTTGHYEVLPKWGGISGLRAAANQMKVMGIRPALHILSGMIQATDAYVTPVPDPRLAWQFGIHNLSTDVNETTLWFPSLQSTADWPNPFGSAEPPQGLAVRIDEEIITYSLATSNPPFGLNVTQRGAFGTKPASHPKGAAMYHLTQRYGSFLPNPNTTLFSEIASNIAALYINAGFEMIYFDALDAFSVIGTSSYALYYGLFHQAFWDAFIPLQKNSTSNLMAESSVYGDEEVGFTWHMNTRNGQTDWSATDPRTWYDFVKSADVERTRCQDLKRADLGWWGYLLWSPAHYATLPDEVGYLATKATAYSSAPSLELDSISALHGNGRTDQAFNILKWWATNGPQLNDSTRDALQAVGIDFVVQPSGDGRFTIVPAKNHARHVANPLEIETTAWTEMRAFPLTPGPLGVRVRALTALALSNSTTNIDLLQATKNPFRSNVCPETGVSNLKWSITSAGELELNFTGDTNTGCFVQQFAGGALDLGSHRAFSVEVLGDGSDALLDFQLTDGFYFRDYFLQISWTGWKLLTLDVPETAELLTNPLAARIPTYKLNSMRDFEWKATVGFSLFITGAPGPTFLKLRNLQAVEEKPATFGANSSLIINNITLHLPSNLGASPCVDGSKNVTSCNDYLECTDINNIPSSCQAYDANNWPLPSDPRSSQEVAPSVISPRLSTVDFVYLPSSTQANTARAEVELLEMSSAKLLSL